MEWETKKIKFDKEAVYEIIYADNEGTDASNALYKLFEHLEKAIELGIISKDDDIRTMMNDVKEARHQADQVVTDMNIKMSRLREWIERWHENG